MSHVAPRRLRGFRRLREWRTLCLEPIALPVLIVPRLVRAMFEMARAKKPSIVFIDEIDSLCTSRSEGQSESSRRIMTEFLVQMQGVGKGNDGILVLGATNIPWEIDSAMRRRCVPLSAPPPPGVGRSSFSRAPRSFRTPLPPLPSVRSLNDSSPARFEKRVYIPLPEDLARRQMFKIHLGDTPNSLTEEELDDLGVMSYGMSGSDISVVVREALMQPVRRCQDATCFVLNHEGKFEPTYEGDPRGRPMRLTDIEGDKLAVPIVEMRDFFAVLGKAKASVGVDELSRYDEWTAEFGEEGA